MEAPNWLTNLRYQFGAVVADLQHNWKPKLKRFRLHIFAFGLFATGILETVDPYSLYGFIPPQYMGIVPIAFGAVLWFMRKVTEHPPTVTTTFTGEQAVTTEPVARDLPGHVDVGVSER